MSASSNAKEKKVSNTQVKNMKEVVRRLDRLTDLDLKDFLEAHGDKGLMMVDPTTIPASTKQKDDATPSSRSAQYMMYYATWKRHAEADFMNACADFLVGNRSELSVLTAESTLFEIQVNLKKMAFTLAAADTYALRVFCLVMDQWLIFEAKVKTTQFAGSDEEQEVARKKALDDMAGNMGKSVEYFTRMKPVHELLKKYPVLKFSGASRDLLLQYRSDFIAQVESAVAVSEKAFWQQKSDDATYVKNLEIMGALKLYIPKALERKAAPAVDHSQDMQDDDNIDFNNAKMAAIRDIEQIAADEAKAQGLLYPE